MLIALVLLLTGCSSIGAKAIKAVAAGGPGIAANAQVGQNNAQTVGHNAITNQRLVRPQARTIEQSSGDTRVKAESVQAVHIDEGSSPWLWFAVIVALFLDSPVRWPGQLWRVAKRR